MTTHKIMIPMAQIAVQMDRLNKLTDLSVQTDKLFRVANHTRASSMITVSAALSDIRRDVLAGIDEIVAVRREVLEAIAELQKVTKAADDLEEVDTSATLAG